MRVFTLLTVLPILHFSILSAAQGITTEAAVHNAAEALGSENLGYNSVSQITAQVVGAPIAGSTPAPQLFAVSAQAPNSKLKAAAVQLKEGANAFNTAEMWLSAGEALTIISAIETFITSKGSCVSAADTAETMCIESKSANAISAKKIVDIGGPVLAAISSAQKACSATADVMGAAQQALSLAKGACVGAKVFCDTSCAKASGELKLISEGITKLFTQTAPLEYNRIAVACTSSLGAQPGCAGLPAAGTFISSANASISQVFVVEAAPEPTGGTTGSLVMTCKGYEKDVGLFAANIMGLLNANKSAKECADKLGTAGKPTSKAEYCEIPANAKTSICVCQKDNNAVGCPGSIGKNNGVDKPKDETGKNIKDAAGVSHFAGGPDSVKPQAIDLDKLKQEEKTDAEKNAAANTKTDGSGSSAFGGGASSASGGHGAADTSKDADGNTDEKKKWSFGSFMGMGGGSSSSGKPGTSATGALGKKQLEEIQRSTASEKLRAEISGASGKSNWEKVNERYLRNSQSLLNGQ